MKNVRKPALPPGWYPGDPAAVIAFLKEVLGGEASPPPQPASAGNENNSGESGFRLPPPDKRPEKAGRGGAEGAVSPFRPHGGAGQAAVAPHAGWYYSGALAARAVSSLVGTNPAVVAVIGGHLPAGARPLFAMEDAVLTPFGEMDIDVELRDLLYGELSGGEDRRADNTVEVLLPMVRCLFPEAKLLWARFPADMSAFEGGAALAAAAASLGRRTVLLASTDLTHYGDAYGFCPRGRGQAALDWVKTVNDRRFIEAVIDGDPKKVLARAGAEKSACSAGAVLAALGFVPRLAAKLLAYRTSADLAGEIPGSFVGYAALALG